MTIGQQMNLENTAAHFGECADATVRLTRMACDDCIALIGKPAAVAPHAALYGERARVRSDGILGHFKCRICGTLWERFEGNRYFKREPQVWTLRSVSNQSVWTNAKANVARR